MRKVCMGQGAIVVDVLQDEPHPELHPVVTHLDDLPLYQPNTVISHLYPGSVVVSPQRGWNTTFAWYVDRTDLCFGDAVKSQMQPVSAQFFSDYGTQVDGTCFAPISAAVGGGYKGAILNAMLFQLAIQKNAPAYLLVDGMFVDRRKQN